MPPPSAPILPSFRIQGFRAFRDLEIPRLGRVNLIVGKNNVGKTTLLEAIKVYAAGLEAAWELREVLERRQEIQRSTLRDKIYLSIDIDRLFFRGPPKDRPKSIRLGPLQGDKELRIQSGRLVIPVQSQDPDVRSHFVMEGDARFYEELQSEEALEIRYGSSPPRRSRLRALNDAIAASTVEARRKSHPELRDSLVCNYVPVRGLNSSSIGTLWDNIVLTANEQSTVEALRLILPDIERVSLIEDPRQPGMRYALVARTGQSSPEPLLSMGDGMTRIFELALGLVSSGNGLFLVDEIENGIHYSIREQLWRFIFEAASQLNVQVFATTHSWDCISAFQKAASSHAENGMLISLAQVNGDIKTAIFDEKDLEIITRQSIEVR
ncbi:AAA family ATPase [Corallococcus macrosporus]|uniref:AAA family ATPase n=1 Tax=Corallococcus macrosporus TaxID=35 RepID=A0ABS3DHN2_9BACT|nr:AAA family ATPase [Corallococcus macrosporus]MBN8230820.1 AAA family ATPase [Corallococcus macrosporus]